MLKAHVHPSDFAHLSLLLFWNSSFVECSVLIGCYFPNDNFQLREIPAMIQGDNGPLNPPNKFKGPRRNPRKVPKNKESSKQLLHPRFFVHLTSVANVRKTLDRSYSVLQEGQSKIFYLKVTTKFISHKRPQIAS